VEGNKGKEGTMRDCEEPEAVSCNHEVMTVCSTQQGAERITAPIQIFSPVMDKLLRKIATLDFFCTQ
jgi:hypothetical protein